MQDEPEVKVPVRADGLQLEDHRGFQRGFWVAERIGWAGFAVVIGLALSGVTGRGGWFAVAEVRAGDAWLELPRIARRGEPAALEVTFAGGAVHSVGLGEDLLAHYDLEGMVPHPSRSVAVDDGLLLEFQAEGSGQARLYLRARQAGVVRMRVVVDGAAVATRGLVLP